MSCEKFEKKLVEKISSMSIIQPAPVTEKFLLDALSGFKEKDIKIEEFCFLLKMFVLQPITRFEGKRNIAKNMLIKLKKNKFPLLVISLQKMVKVALS